MPELIGTLNTKEPPPATAAEPSAALDEPLLAHDAQHAFAVYRPP